MREFLDWLDVAPLPFSLEGFLVAVNLLTLWFLADAVINPVTPEVAATARVVFLICIVSLLVNVWLWMDPS